LGGKPSEEVLLGRPRYRNAYNMKTDFKEVGWKGMALSRLGQVRDKWSAVLNVVRNFWVS
jgi:hypothetical protein